MQTHEEATVCQIIGYILDNGSPRGYASSLIAIESFAMNTDTLMNGSTVKNHISLKTVFGDSATRRTSFRSWFLVYQRVLPQAETRAGQITIPRLCQVNMWIEKHGVTRYINQQKPPNKKKRITIKNRETRAIPKYLNGCKNSETILWITEFLNTPRAEDALAESYLEQKILVILLQQITKVFSEGCESRNSHRFAIVVQDLATQWIQSYPCKTKTSQETHRSLQKLLEPTRKPKVIYTVNSLEFGKAREDLSWNHCTPTPHKSETNGIAERAVRRVKEDTSAVLLQPGLDENWWADSMECYTYLRNIQDLLSDGKTQYERRFGEPFKGPIIPFGSLVEYHPITAKDQSRIHQFGKKVLPKLFLGYALYAEGIWKGDILVADSEELETMDASEIYSKKAQCKGSNISQRKLKHYFPAADGRKKLLEEIMNWEHPPRYGITQFEEKVEGIFLENQKGLHLHHLKTHFGMPVKR